MVMRLLACLVVSAATLGSATGSARTRNETAAALDSTMIAYAAGGEIRTISASGTGMRTVAAGEAPSWSPDGRQLVFQSARNGPDADLWLTYGDGSNQRRIVTHVTRDDNDDSRDDFDPAWSPVDDVIAFVSNRNGNDDIWRTNSIGHSTGDLTRDSAASDKAPAWSPDGTAFAFVSDRAGDDDIYTMRSDGSDVTRLAPSAAPDESPAWSPDGRALAFQSFRDGNWEIYVVRVDGSALRRITDDSAADTSPSWSPDGRQIVFTSDRDRSHGPQLFVVASGGGDVRQLATQGAVAKPDWQPAVDLRVSARRSAAARGGHGGRIAFSVSESFQLPALRVALTIRVPHGVRVLAARASRGGCTGSRPIHCSLRTLTPATPVRVDLAWTSTTCSPGRVVASVSGLRVEADNANNTAAPRLEALCSGR